MAKARVVRWVVRAGVAGLAAALLVTGGAWLTLRASLAQIDGERALPGLAAPVRVERDDHGVPTLRGESRADVSRALGFVHAQERFFQMDLLRRRSAGELAELFGPAALPLDRAVRVHRFRSRAGRVVAAASPEDRGVMDAYAAGVNAGLAAQGARAPEYLLLRSLPVAWRPEDSILVVYSMFLDLHDETGSHESALGVMHDVLPEPLFAFLSPRGTEWDAPVVGGPFVQPPLPGPETLDLRAVTPTLKAADATAGPGARDEEGDARAGLALLASYGVTGEDAAALGSNNWAVAGTHTADGGALLADDMHLGHAAPNIWYRASLSWPDPGDAKSTLRVTGVTLPGTPGVVVGSNGHVAWGFTNSQGDWGDLVELEAEPGDPASYRVPQGVRRFETFRETIRVRGRADETLEVRETIFGPVIDKDHRGRLRAVRWTAHDPEAVNLGLLQVETSRDLDTALLAAARAGIPPQNFVCADAAGRIGWTIAGRIPRRFGHDGRLPSSWADGSRGWNGWLAPEEYPRVVDPESGRLWSANARVVEGEALAEVGHGNYALGARARQIRDDLLAIDKATPRDLLNVQLDDRALFLARWRDALLAALDEKAVAGSAARAELRGLVERWGGHAAVDSVGYRAVRAFRGAVARRVFPPLLAAAAKASPSLDYLSQVWQYEGPLWALVGQRPPHLLDPKYASWDALLLDAADSVIADLTKDGARLPEQTWGRRNTLRAQHPLSRALPALSGFLDLPAAPLPGDSDMPRVQAPTHGASERLVVSPGREERGFFHMPGGQSGHPLSPWYRAGHEAWARGEATPFLPGPTTHTLTLAPAR
jgi:penicillin G amidase